MSEAWGSGSWESKEESKKDDNSTIKTSLAASSFSVMVPIMTTIISIFVRKSHAIGNPKTEATVPGTSVQTRQFGSLEGSRLHSRA